MILVGGLLISLGINITLSEQVIESDDGTFKMVVITHFYTHG